MFLGLFANLLISFSLHESAQVSKLHPVMKHLHPDGGMAYPWMTTPSFDPKIYQLNQWKYSSHLSHLSFFIYFMFILIILSFVHVCEVFFSHVR